jgi:preprotein translocase subunit YajC
MFDWALSLHLLAQDGLLLAQHGLLLAQGDGAAPAEGAAGGKGFFGDVSFLPVMLVIGVMFYLMLIRPEQKRKAQVAQMQQGLKKNDRIVTIGGIYGTVVNPGQGGEDVTIRIDESSNSKMRIERGSIKRIISDEKNSTDEDKKESD